MRDCSHQSTNFEFHTHYWQRRRLLLPSKETRMETKLPAVTVRLLAAVDRYILPVGNRSVNDRMPRTITHPHGIWSPSKSRVKIPKPVRRQSWMSDTASIKQSATSGTITEQLSLHHPLRSPDSKWNTGAACSHRCVNGYLRYPQR